MPKGRVMNEQAVKEPPALQATVQMSQAVPLPAPLSMLIDPANGCNFRCTFCPTGNPEMLKEVGRPIGVMKLPMFTKIVEGMAAFPTPVKTVMLYKDGEPLLNNWLGDMIALMKQRRVALHVSTTTNAALLNETRARMLIESGLDSIRISVEHVHDEGYRRITKTFSDYQMIVDNVAFLHAEKARLGSPLQIHAKVVDAGLTELEKAKFMADFSPISDHTSIDSIMGWSNTGTDDMMLGLDPETGIDGVTPLKRNRVVCPSPFKTLAVNFNGEVSVCCVDWSHDTVVGDLREESLLDVWDGARLRAFRLAHLKGQRATLKACENCQYMQGYGADSDLDDVADAVAARIEAQDPTMTQGPTLTQDPNATQGLPSDRG
ncbi:MAG: radical SAM protein [Rhodospirillaceae bacterium]|nr:radical SAM protein [Rhodospirillaceae bacterium]